MSRLIKLSSGLLVPHRKNLTRRALLAGLGASIIVPKEAKPGIIIDPYRFSSASVTTLIGVITSQSQTTNLRLCLDAGDDLSAPSSPTKWLDRSGNGYDFFRGETGSGEATDPTFNGSVGGGLGSSQYWSFDGGDYFTYDTTNETWMNNIHKDNATFTLLTWVYFGANTPGQVIMGDTSSTIGAGFIWRQPTTGALSQQFAQATGSASNSQSQSGTTFATGAWTFLAYSLNEGLGTNNAFWQTNTIQTTQSRAYTTPTGSNAATTLRIGDRGAAQLPLSSGSRMACMAAWEGRALSITEIDDIFQATRALFGV